MVHAMLQYMDLFQQKEVIKKKKNCGGTYTLSLCFYANKIHLNLFKRSTHPSLVIYPSNLIQFMNSNFAATF